MKTIILAGGLGTRLAEKTQDLPKPMVEIGGRPILWHIMSFYASYKHEEFVVALGYKPESIKSYFLNFYALNSNLTIDLKDGTTTVHKTTTTPWKVHLVDTGLHTQTGGRIKRLREWIGDETFMMTYGDGLSNVNLDDLVAFHKAQGKLATVTGVRPPARFGGLTFDGHDVTEFSEKPQTGEGWINGGFFVLEPGIFDYIDDDHAIWEKGPLERLAKDKQLVSYRHEGFWQPMDTLREHKLLQETWETGTPPWRVSIS